MEEQKAVTFEQAVDALTVAKRFVLEQVELLQQAPAVQHTGRLATDHLDTAYLFVSQLMGLVQRMSADIAAKAQAAANNTANDNPGAFGKLAIEFTPPKA